MDQSERATAAFNYLTTSGRLTGVTKRPDTWVSSSNHIDGRISIGIGRVGVGALGRGGIALECSTQEEALQHRFYHEMAHLLMIDRGYEDVDALPLYDMTKKIRRNNQNKLGASALGSIDFYGEGVRYLEDAAEVMALLLRGDDVTQQHLDYLTDQESRLAKRERGLATISTRGVEQLAIGAMTALLSKTGDI